MITSPLIYLFVLATLVTVLSLSEQKMKLKLFRYIPAVVFIYAASMALASFGAFEFNEDVEAIYKLTKINLLPAMLFLMLIQVDFRHFFKLGKKLLLAYVLAIFSLACGFIIISLVFDFNKDMASAFGALAGSWMGGTANMVAVGSALEVSNEAFGYALIVDSFNYTLWVAMLLFFVPFAKVFNSFTKAKSSDVILGEIGCRCNMGVKRYWFLIVIALVVSLLSQVLSEYVGIISKTTTIVLLATLFGTLASFTKLKEINGSSQVANSMLYMMIALIGSHAIFDSFSGVGVYVLAGFLILLIHALFMIVGAKIFKLDLFSISIASLSNIGGVASAPILAATYNKSLVSIGVLMAIMGYIIGTFGGLLVGNILMRLAS